jgi:anti-sigma regulatory factor (Ser/Thr protein kinase)
MADPMTLTVSGALGWQTLPDFLRQLESVKRDAPTKVTMDLSAMNYCWPIGVAILVGTVLWLRRAGVEPSVRRPATVEVEQYLTRIDFYRVLNAPDKMKFNRLDGGGRFVEVTQLASEQDCAAVAKSVEAVFEGNMRLSNETRNALDFVVTELSENIFQHAQSAEGGILCCQSYPDSLQLALVDLGRGVEQALSDNPVNLNVVRQKGPLHAAIEPRVTGKPALHTGFGLFWTSELVKENGGEFGIQSHDRRLSQKSEFIQEQAQGFWPGTAIHLSFKREKPLDIVKVFQRLAPPEKDFEFIG